MAREQSVETSADDGQQSRKRQKLSNGTELTSTNDRNISPHQNGKCVQEIAAKRFDKLTELTDEIFETPATIGDHIESAGEDIVRLALELNLKLREWKESKSLDQLRSESLPETFEQGPVRAYDSKLLETLHETRRGLQYRPPLPPVTDPSLSQAVFTHQGTLNAKNSAVQGLSYERLELLGDAYLELIATRVIYSRFPHLSTGRLSQLRQLLVRNETLKEFADRYHFDEKIQIPDGLRQKRGKPIPIKVAADVFEAYVAAVILSDPVNGFAKTEEWLLELWSPKLLDPEIAPEVPIGATQELSKRIMGGGPSYRIEYRDVRKPDNAVRDGTNYFQMGVYFTGWGWTNQFLGSGCGLSKKEASQRAAKSALENKPLIDEITAVRQAALAPKDSQQKV